jgi:lipid-A-disaccharide synthase
MGQAPFVALVAGEASGDLLAGHLVRALRERWPHARFAGIAGPKMVEAGVEAWWPSEKLAVRGYVEVLRHYREISGIRSALARRLIADPPDVFIGVDAPDFNLDLEVRLREAGVKTCHFVSPSVWAWRAGRMDKIRRAVSHMLCLFPFEEKLYRDAGIAATFVGHPLADVIAPDASQADARSALGLPEHARVIALLPGSRQSELRYLADRFVTAAQYMSRMLPEAKFVVPLASPETEVLWRDTVLALEARTGIPVPPMVMAPRATHRALAACDVALVASGTATLEVALFKRPMVIAYNMAPITWSMMRRMKYQPYVGLPNILCGKFVVPEFLQEDASAENLAQATLSFLQQPNHGAQVAECFAGLHHMLRRGSAERAATAVADLLAA